MNLISIITPSYNRGQYLKIARAKLERQTFRKFQWIIVDNGSDEYTRTVEESIRKESSFEVRLIEESRRGPSAARNAGLECADTPYVAYLDDDDFLSETMLGEWVDSLDRYDVAVAPRITHFCRIFAAYSLLLKLDFSELKGRVDNGYFAETARDVAFAQCAFRRDFVNGIWWDADLDFREDILYMAAIFARNPSVGFTGGVGEYFYRRYPRLKDRSVDINSVSGAMKAYQTLVSMQMKRRDDGETLKKMVDAEIYNMWLKVSLVSEIAAAPLEKYMAANGIDFRETRIRRKMLRMIKWPFRKFPQMQFMYAGLSGYGKLGISGDPSYWNEK